MKNPIDGIWTSRNIRIMQGGYLNYDELVKTRNIVAYG